MHDAVARDEVDPIARVRSERRQQQRGIHRGVESRRVTDAAGRGPRRVEHDHDVPVLLRLPRADDDGAASSGGTPVDAAYVVALDIVTERVEFGALTAGADS
ncbi:Uncharacterised protein [Mycobacteroides abscessus subsp. abscessus]|nr:Uncharacterised protein [Mycobacteroides abscessus subsp. abscessus]